MSKGYPIATLPLGYLYFNGTPFAMAVVAKEHREDILIEVQSAWEATFPARQSPSMAWMMAGSRGGEE